MGTQSTVEKRIEIESAIVKIPVANLGRAKLELLAGQEQCHQQRKIGSEKSPVRKQIDSPLSRGK